MNELPERPQRPTSITVVCAIGIYGALVTIPLLFSATANEIHSWYPLHLAGSLVIGLVCMIGLWFMKKWAAYAYTAFVVVNQLILISLEIWTVMAILAPAVVVFFALRHVHEMT